MALAIKAENLCKYYRLGVINTGVLWKDLQSHYARFFGKEDPNRPIGQGVYDRKGFWALSDINLEIEQGDRVAVMGKNGAGKSTLLKIFSRITAPTRGCFHVKGKIASLLEVGTGFHGELTGRENIYMNGAILGMKRREIKRKIDEIIEFSEIAAHIDTPVKRYSSGMYIRLGFAIAAYLECEIMIADEALAVGDLAFQQKALSKMRELSTERGRTVLFVSHNVRAVSALCNKGLILEEGRITMEQSPVREAVARFKEILGIE
jgi:lipopolysaccharide transport system ATP-binding protein